MWIPKTEAEIQRAIDEGALAENQHLDVKKSTGDSEGGRKETAKDLASFSTYGGVLLIGVLENKEARTFELTPISLDGAAEKVNQIAAQRIDPPLNVIVNEIPSETDPNVGYLAVEIPPSNDAPHQTSGIYYGRADKTTRRLTDAEIAQLHRRRRDLENLTMELLDAEIDRDPVPATRRKLGHVYLVAQPTTGSRSLARRLARSSGKGELFALFNGAEHLVPRDIRVAAPAPSQAGHQATRSQGNAQTSNFGGDRELAENRDESDLADFELREDGGIRGVVGRATETMTVRHTEIGIIFDALIVAYALRLVGWAKAVSEETGYRGSWALGIAVTGLRGRASHMFYGGGMRQVPSAYDADEYRGATTATYSELTERPKGVAHDLVGGLLRGLETSERWEAAFADGEV
jgi:hypothetical protein